MQELNEKAKFNDAKLKKIITTTAATELSKLSEPCHYPSLKKIYYELLRYTGLTDKDVKAYVKRFYSGHPASGWLLTKDPYSNLLLFIMAHFLEKKDNLAFNYTMVFYNIRVYSNLMNKQIKHCDPEAFKYALEHLVKNHLFAVHKTIGNAIYYLSQEMVRKHRDTIQTIDINARVKFIQECRHRHSQSIKSFAELYYEAKRTGIAYKTPIEDEGEDGGSRYQEIAKSSKVVSDAMKKICVYKQVDKKALIDAKTITKISTSFATVISKTLSNTEYSDQVKIVLDLFVKNLKNINSFCGDDYFKFVQSLMAVKRTNSHIYFKQQIEILLKKVLEEAKLIDKYEKQTNQTKHLNKLFLAYYVTMVMRNLSC